METSTEIRCRQCGKLLAKGRAEVAHIEFKCPRCGAYTILRASRSDTEPHEGRRSFPYGSDNVQGIPAHAGSQRLHV